MVYRKKAALAGVVAVLSAALLLASCGASSSVPASSAAASSEPAAVSSEAASSEPATEETGLTYTQNVMVVAEKYKEEAAFVDFLSKAEPTFLIPGLNQYTTPQGMDLCDETGILYISAYHMTDGKPSVIMAVDTASGEIVAEYNLYKAGGVAFDGHVGGIAVSEDTLYFSGQKNSNGDYTIVAIPLSELAAEGSHDITIEKTITVPVSPSFLNYSSGYLWVGNFYHPSVDSYQLSDGMLYTTTNADGEECGCYIMGYDLSSGGEARMTVTDGDTYVQPDVVLVAPNKIQGAVIANDTVTLSQSYGRKNNSHIYHYELSLAETLDTMVTVQGRDVPAYVLDSKRLLNDVEALPMTEALADAPDGSVYVLFESGSMHYVNGTFRTDRVWKINFEQ